MESIVTSCDKCCFSSIDGGPGPIQVCSLKTAPNAGYICGRGDKLPKECPLIKEPVMIYAIKREDD